MSDIKRKNYSQINQSEKFKVTAIYEGFHGNCLEILVGKDRHKIATDKSVELDKGIIGKYVEVKHTKDGEKYYFKRINYSIK